MKTWSIIRKILWIIIFLAFSSGAAGDGLYPVGQPEYELLYDRFYRAGIAEPADVDLQLGPYSSGIAAIETSPLAWLSEPGEDRLRLFMYLTEDFTGTKNEESQAFESVRAGIVATPHEKIYAYAGFSLDEQLAENPDYTGKKWRGLAGRVDQAFINLHTGGLSLTIGRFASFWGPRQSLALASGASMDGIGYTYRWGRLCLSYRLAGLDGLNPDVDPVTQFENRYFAAHRLDLHVRKNLRVGFFETAVFGGPGRQIDLYYLNPLLFYHADQLNDGQNDNTMLGFDVDYQPWSGVNLFAQVLVDDLQVDDAAAGDNEPAEIGLIGGLQLFDIIDKTDFELAYSRVTNRTFNQVIPRNRYLYEGQPIGDVLGNDYDLIKISAAYWAGKFTRVKLGWLYHRQGEGRITDDWTSPWLATGDEDYSEPFPTGVVQSTNTIAAEFTGFLLNHIYFDVRGGIDLVDNFGHIENDNRTIPWLRIGLSVFASHGVKVR